MNFLTILINLSRLWWQKKDTISKTLQQRCNFLLFLFAEKHFSTLNTFFTTARWWAVRSASSSQSAARTQLCQHRGVDMEVFPMWSKHFKPRGWLTNTSHSSVARICRTKHHFFFFLFFFWRERDLAFGFDGGLYPGSIFIRVKVRSRYHSGEQRILTLRSQSKK